MIDRGVEGGMALFLEWGRGVEGGLLFIVELCRVLLAEGLQTSVIGGHSHGSLL